MAPRSRRLVIAITVCVSALVVGGCTTATGHADWSAAMLARVNAVRAAAGVGPLGVCGPLMRSSAQQSTDQAALSKLTHTGANGSTLTQRTRIAGLTAWTELAENVGVNGGNTDAVIDMWLQSAPHRANLLHATYNNVGFGRATSASGETYWTQDFSNGGCA
jgi:uncharacterized protein YkwD